MGEKPEKKAEPKKEEGFDLLKVIEENVAKVIAKEIKEVKERIIKLEKVVNTEKFDEIKRTVDLFLDTEKRINDTVQRIVDLEEFEHDVRIQLGMYNAKHPEAKSHGN